MRARHSHALTLTHLPALELAPAGAERVGGVLVGQRVAADAEGAVLAAAAHVALEELLGTSAGKVENES